MSKGVHRFALLVAGATFFLIIAGANVTSHDAGLATSDWPLSNGQFFPKMVGNLFWEHGHRLVATTVGILTIVLALYLQFRERRTWVKRLGWIALGGVVAQGLLGGLTVKLNLPLAVSAASHLKLRCGEKDSRPPLRTITRARWKLCRTALHSPSKTTASRWTRI